MEIYYLKIKQINPSQIEMFSIQILIDFVLI